MPICRDSKYIRLPTILSTMWCDDRKYKRHLINQSFSNNCIRKPEIPEHYKWLVDGYLSKRLKIINRFKLSEAYNPKILGWMLATWIWNRAVEKIKDVWAKYSVMYESLASAKIEARLKFPTMENLICKIQWQMPIGDYRLGGIFGQVSLNLHDVRRRLKSENEMYVEKLAKKLKNSVEMLLKVVRVNKRSGVLWAERVSGRRIDEKIVAKHTVGRRIYSCSTSIGAGLLEHKPFLKDLIGKEQVCFRNKDRLGRSGWVGIIRILRKVIKVGFDSHIKGKDLPNVVNLQKRLASAGQLIGWFVIPDMLGIGISIGKVALVSPEVILKGRVLLSIAPGDDWRAETILILLGIVGIKSPIKLAAPVKGPAMLIRGDKRVKLDSSSYMIDLLRQDVAGELNEYI